MTIVVGGDVMFGRFAEAGFLPRNTPMIADGLAQRFKAADLAIVNLETPVVAMLPNTVTDTRMRFAATPAQLAPFVQETGLDILGLANNHARDLGTPAETAAHVREVNSTPVGHDLQPVRVNRAGVRLAIFALSAFSNRPTDGMLSIVPLRNWPTTLASAIRAIRGDVDAIILLAHWGDEYLAAPTDEQQLIARTLIDAGIDVIIGSHPHVLQGVERYHRGWIVYSLGNLSFDDSTAPRDVAAIAELAIRPRKGRNADISVRLTPIVLNGVTGPDLALGARAETVRAAVRARSAVLDNGIEDVADP